MRSSTSPVLDPRHAAELAAAFLARRPGYLQAWDPAAKSPGDALVRIWARYVEAILERLSQAPEKNKLAFLELLGIELIPARPARVPVVFQLAQDAPAGRLPAGSQVAAPPPPETAGQVVFETERALGLGTGRLRQVVSLWPGRDQYVNHSEAFLAGETIRLFERPLTDTPHILYVAHDTLLALAGQVRLDVEFELSQGGSERLDVIWEYWDGKVWRGFKQQHPQCAETDEPPLDATAGLTRSGKFRLEADCAESKKKTVDGVEACWIRGRLDEPLPLDPDRILPEATQLRLSTVVQRGPILKKVKEEYRDPSDFLLLWTTNGKPITEAYLELFDASASSKSGRRNATRTTEGKPITGVYFDDTRIASGYSKSALTAATKLVEGREYELRITLLGSVFTHPLVYRKGMQLDFTFDLGISADSAFSGAEALDLTKPFYPFGQQPGPGSVFYFASEEIFSKPGARVSLNVQTTGTPQDKFELNATGTLDHQVAWEYWNGREWSQIDFYSSQDEGSTRSARGFTDSGEIELVVPDDVRPVKVNDEEGFWMRARLVNGGYGFTKTVKFNDNTLTYVIPHPPALAGLQLTYTWEYGPFHPERVLAYNDFQYVDQTDAAKWPDVPFLPFRQAADLTPALYLGFDRQLPVDRLNLYFDLVEIAGESAGAALAWEYWQGVGWRPLRVEDETGELAHPGMVSLLGPADAASVARFGEDLYFLRARLKEDAPPAEREVRGIHPNAAWASQWRTVVEENLGASDGRPRQVFVFRNVPVLEGERLEVREASGPRAAVEWRILAAEVLGEARKVRDLEDRLGREGDETDVVEGDLRLRRDRRKLVTEVWVRWLPRRHLLASGENDRHYVLGRARGLLAFGDGVHGKIPPLGAEIRAREYKSGGGRAGNVAAGAVSQALNGVAGVEKVMNPAPAEGGADAETLERVTTRGPRTLRHRGRALLPSDFETLAVEASSAVAVARALPTRDAAGRDRPGWVTLVIIPRSEEPRPQPSFGLRERVRRHIEERADAGLAAAHRLHVRGPEYRAVDVEATLAPRDPAEAGAVETAARDALETFLHPLLGGGQGLGWEPGRDVYLSDVAAVLERVEGVDYVRDLALRVDGRLQGEQARVPAGETVVAGEITLQLILAEDGP